MNLRPRCTHFSALHRGSPMLQRVLLTFCADAAHSFLSRGCRMWRPTSQHISTRISNFAGTRPGLTHEWGSSTVCVPEQHELDRCYQDLLRVVWISVSYPRKVCRLLSFSTSSIGICGARSDCALLASPNTDASFSWPIHPQLEFV